MLTMRTLVGTKSFSGRRANLKQSANRSVNLSLLPLMFAKHLKTHLFNYRVISTPEDVYFSPQKFVYLYLDLLL